MPGSFLTTDLAELFDTEDFASAATFGGSTINVILDDEYVGTDVGGEVQVEGSYPVAYAATSDVVGAGHGDTISISSVTYTITGREDDNTGVTVLKLRK